MVLTLNSLLNRIAEKTVDNTSQLRKGVNQRRNGMEDLYGVPFYAVADSNNEAKFYVSVSPDIVYFERFAFKLHITGTTSEEWSVLIDGVDITDYLIAQHEGEWIDGSGIYPTDEISSESESFLQDFYDILDVASILYAEGNDDDADDLLEPEFKEVVIRSDAPFTVTAYFYTKYSNVNR